MDDMGNSEIVFEVRHSPEGGYEAYAIGHPIFTQAETREQLERNVRDAVQCHFGEQTMPNVRFTDVRPESRMILGSAKGDFTVPDNFNDPLPKEIEDLFYNSRLFPKG